MRISFSMLAGAGFLALGCVSAVAQQIGQDTRTDVAMVEYRYDVLFKFTGKIDKLTFNLEPFPPEQSAATGTPDSTVGRSQKQ